MTFIIYGVGAIGGALAAKLIQSGQPVAGIARGAQLQALQSNGLLLRTPDGDFRARFPAVEDPTELDLRPDDIVFLCMKSQDTLQALERLRAAGVRDQAIVCAQNGVANEREALRNFANVYAMLVVMPATFIEPGEVAAFGAPHAGLFDIGRYPAGIDATVGRIVDVLNGAGFAAFGQEAPMVSKYGKLLMNLGNVLDAAVGEAAFGSDLYAAAKAEGEAVLQAAGIAYADVGPDNDRRKQLMQMQKIPGVERVGSSSAQSLARGTGSIETDYLNGEIVLLGRLHGVPVPVNAGLCRLGHILVAEKRSPGSLSLDDVRTILADA
jgi:2-dehydropantoate 2-reductase